MKFLWFAEFQNYKIRGKLKATGFPWRDVKSERKFRDICDI